MTASERRVNWCGTDLRKRSKTMKTGIQAAAAANTDSDEECPEECCVCCCCDTEDECSMEE